MIDIPDYGNNESKIDAICTSIDAAIASGGRSADALMALEAACMSLGRLCATHTGSSDVADRGFAAQLRGLNWIHTATDC